MRDVSGETNSGPCRTCGQQGAGRYCSRCGTPLGAAANTSDRSQSAAVQDGPWKPARNLYRLKMAGLGIVAMSLLTIGGVSLAGFQHVPSSGICFANPLSKTSLWPYTASSRQLRLTLYLGPSPQTTYERNYDEAAHAAIKAWSLAWPVIHFVQVQRASRADIVIHHAFFGTSGFWYDHAGLTVPRVNVLGCGLSRATIDINDSYLVHDGLTQYGQPMLRHLLLHELGHALGLKHVYRPIASVMVPTSEAYRYVKPQPYDISTISRLYPLPVSPHVDSKAIH